MKLADGETNAFTLLIQADHFDLNLLADFENIFGMLDAFPRNLRQVDQTIGSVDIDKSTKVRQAGNATFTLSANRQFVEQAVFERFARLVQGFAF